MAYRGTFTEDIKIAEYNNSDYDWLLRKLHGLCTARWKRAGRGNRPCGDIGGRALKGDRERPQCLAVWLLSGNAALGAIILSHIRHVKDNS